jgi:hypothetical protein
MPSTFPTTNDTFAIPSDPTNTNLSSAGSGTLNHPQHHQNLGDAIMALEANVALLTHDHSGGTGAHATAKLAQANTHQSADTDTATTAIHHTLGTGPNQASAGTHTHSYEYLGIATNDANGWGVWTNCVPQSGFYVPADSQYPPSFPKGVKVRRHVSGICAITGMLNFNGAPANFTKMIQLPTDANGKLSWAPATGLGAAFVVKSNGPYGVCGICILQDGGVYIDGRMDGGGTNYNYIYVTGVWSAV